MPGDSILGSGEPVEVQRCTKGVTVGSGDGFLMIVDGFLGVISDLFVLDHVGNASWLRN